MKFSRVSLNFLPPRAGFDRTVPVLVVVNSASCDYIIHVAYAICEYGCNGKPIFINKWVTTAGVDLSGVKAWSDLSAAIEISKDYLLD